MKISTITIKVSRPRDARSVADITFTYKYPGL